MRSNWFFASLVSVCVVSIAGCGSGSSASPTSPSPSPAPAPALSLAGTWTGAFTQPGESNPIRINSWIVTQSGASVSGPMVVNAGEGGLVNGTLTGTVSGAQLTSATFTVAAGAISFLPTCSIRGTGTLAATTSSVSGPLAVVVAPNAAPCVGAGDDGGISNTATETWTFSLTK